jgi:hypothetical protein
MGNAKLLWWEIRAFRAALISQLARHKLGGMQNLSSGIGGFTFCLLIGIIFDQVALGIIAGLFFGGALSARKTKGPGDSSDTPKE